MTEQIYYQNPYEKQFHSIVTAVQPYKKRWAVELDKTIFYPEGGGQPGDRGSIGGVEISTTIKRDGHILHITANEPSLKPGDTVHIELEWGFRYDYMQQHTGQHLISGSFYSLLDIGTVSVHQGEEYTTIDIDRAGITEEDIAQVEDEVNRRIAADSPVSYREVSEQEAAEMQMRREPKVSGSVRVVVIEECDQVACGGIHLNSTSQVQLVLCIGTEQIRGITRTVWKIGRRAVEDYRLKDRLVRSLVELYSAKPEDVAVQAEAKAEQVRVLQQQLAQADQELAGSIITDALKGQTGSSSTHSIVTLDLTGMREGLLKLLVREIPQNLSLALCAVQETDQGMLQWIISISPDIGVDFSPIRDTLFPIIDAKGGGKPPVWQGAGSRAAQKEQFLEQFARMFT